MYLGKYIITLGRSKCAWTHFRIHKHEANTLVVWGKYSLNIIDNTVECYAICGECGYNSLKNISFGDESLRICESCHTTEGDVRYVNYLDMERAEVV